MPRSLLYKSQPTHLELLNRAKTHFRGDTDSSIQNYRQIGQKVTDQAMIGHLNKNTPKQRQKVYGRSELQKCVKNIIKSRTFLWLLFYIVQREDAPYRYRDKIKS